MSSFSMVLLEEGVEMDLPAELSDVLAMLDSEVPGFSCDKYGYKLSSVTRARLGSRWDLLVRLVDLEVNAVIEAPVGIVEVEKTGDYQVHFRIPPRSEEDFPGINEYDPTGRLFGSLICHLLNTFQNKGLIKLPGMLPVS